MKKYSLGIDVGSSSVKVALLEIESGIELVSSTNPTEEMFIHAEKPGWAEQDPEMWWEYTCKGIKTIAERFDLAKIASIGISYQMHGLVLVDTAGIPLRKSIIWCDSRAVRYGEAATEAIGKQHCLKNLLNQVGNFTASKLAWVKENEPEIYKKTYKIMLPGDYISYRLTGEMTTTKTGLSEGIFWDFQKSQISSEVLSYYGFEEGKLCQAKDSLGIHATTSSETKSILGIPEGTPISYKAGDQPNNAFSLNVLEPGEIAATGGTSGVIYGVVDAPNGDLKSRVNNFIHINHTDEQNRYGVLLCINGVGIANAWVRKNITPNLCYPEMNEIAETIPIGSDGIIVLPFGNGAERMLENTYLGSSFSGLDFSRHTNAHIVRAVQEGIAFAFGYGIEIMKQTGMKISTIRAGKANLFLSKVFTQTLATLCDAQIELYNTDGALGAARGAALGIGGYKSREEVFASLKVLEKIFPEGSEKLAVMQAYELWKNELNIKLK